MNKRLQAKIKKEIIHFAAVAAAILTYNEITKLNITHRKTKIRLRR